MDGPAPLMPDANGKYPVPQPGIVTNARIRQRANGLGPHLAYQTDHTDGFSSRHLQLRRLLILAAVMCVAPLARAARMDDSAAVELSQRYLESHNRAERTRLAAVLANYVGDIDSVVLCLSREARGGGGRPFRE